MNALAGTSASLQAKVLNTMRAMFKNALTASQKKTLLQAMNGTNAYTFVMLGLNTGMRREEILGLKWDCVFLTGKTPHVIVKRAVRWDITAPSSAGELKYEAAARTIPIPKELVSHLKQLQQPDGHVVGGDPLTQTQFKNLWRLVTNRKVGAKTYTMALSFTRRRSLV